MQVYTCSPGFFSASTKLYSWRQVRCSLFLIFFSLFRFFFFSRSRLFIVECPQSFILCPRPEWSGQIKEKKWTGRKKNSWEAKERETHMIVRVKRKSVRSLVLGRGRERERENERAPYVPICLLVVSGSCGSLWWLCMFVYEKTRKQWQWQGESLRWIVLFFVLR